MNQLNQIRARLRGHVGVFLELVRLSHGTVLADEDCCDLSLPCVRQGTWFLPWLVAFPGWCCNLPCHLVWQHPFSLLTMSAHLYCTPSLACTVVTPRHRQHPSQHLAQAAPSHHCCVQFLALPALLVQWRTSLTSMRQHVSAFSPPASMRNLPPGPPRFLSSCCSTLC